MAELFWPAAIDPAASKFDIIDGAGRFRSPFTGRVRVIDRPGATRVRATLDLTGLHAAMRAALQSFIAGQLGAVNRVWLKDHSYTRRGSFPASELFTNNIFENGTTGWTSGTNATLSVTDRVAKHTVTSLGSFQRELYQSVAAVQYAPYALRSIIVDGRESAGLNIGRALNLASGVQPTDYGTGRGLGTLAGVMLEASSLARSPLVWSDNSGFSAGAYVLLPFTSLARCALADGGGNLLLQSADFTTTWANTRSSDAANSTAAPDGTTTADSIIEDSTASSTHFVRQSVTVSSAAADYAFSVSLRAGTRSWAAIVMSHSAGTATAFVNLSTGALGTVSGGTNWTNARAFVVSQGNGWYRLTLVSRKTSSDTSIQAEIYTATGDFPNYTYTGDGASLIYAWGASLTQSSTPVRYVATTTTAATASAQSGTRLYLKGLPASTAGLLLPGDQVQVGNELKFVTAALDSDAAGLGYLQFAPALRETAANDAPVIVHEPMGRFMLESDESGWSNSPGVFSSSQITLIDA